MFATGYLYSMKMPSKMYIAKHTTTGLNSTLTTLILDIISTIETKIFNWIYVPFTKKFVNEYVGIINNPQSNVCSNIGNTNILVTTDTTETVLK